MDTIIEAFLKSIVLNEVARVDGFAVVVLSPGQDGTLDYVALQAAIAAHSVRVREVSASGSVGDLLITNVGSNRVLALDGEELVGAKQNRILNTTVLLGEGSETVIPVSCTEQGRWAYVSSEFTPSSSFAPPSIRENAKRAVNRALAEDRGFRANQGEVWHGVAKLARERGVDSPTSAMNDVVKSRLPELDGVLASIPPRAGQCGLLAIADGRVLGFDIVSRPEAYAHLHERLLRSYLMETLPRSVHTPASDPAAAAREFLKAAAMAEEKRFESVALGQDYRYNGKDIVGSALVHEGEVVHMAFFGIPPDEATGWEPGMRSVWTRAGFRKREAIERQSGVGIDRPRSGDI
jgi:hypothetical protein